MEYRAIMPDVIGVGLQFDLRDVRDKPSNAACPFSQPGLVRVDSGL
jgi:hypothetical protein